MLVSHTLHEHAGARIHNKVGVVGEEFEIHRNDPVGAQITAFRGGFTGFAKNTVFIFPNFIPRKQLRTAIVVTEGMESIPW